MKRSHTQPSTMRIAALAVPGILIAIGIVLAAQTVPTEIEQPGTQPGEVGAFATNCDSCHGGTSNPDVEPSRGWWGSMMAHAARDPIFWATVAIAEQDFLPDPDPNARGGAGDLCLRCHSPNAWLGQRSTPTDGSSLTGADDRGVECEHCHLMVDPDAPVNIPGTVEEQHPPYEAFDAITGEAHYGSGQYVINSEGSRLGPYAEGDEQAKHKALGSAFIRSSDFCGTCHDVSNPAVGDLAYNHGARIPLDPGTYSGVVGAPVDDKAAFNNPPYRYGVVERTYSEWKSSAYPTARVNDFPSLPADLTVAGGTLDVAYHRAYDARSNADYEDGTARFYTCQTCHLAAATGVGANKQNMPVRTDLPRHDMTGSGYWMPDVVIYQDDAGTLRFGGGLDQATRDAMTAGKQRAVEMLRSAATLSGSQAANDLVVRVTNLTGHKLISGYPEGRRMWINIRWLDGGGGLLAEDGGYGPIGRSVDDLSGTPHPVESILDLDGTVIYEAEAGMDQQWAAQLIALGYDSGLAISYDRITDAVDHTLGELAAELPGEAYHSFHFVLNNVLMDDPRIPPYGFAYDEARNRNTLPVPETRFGDPGPGGIYDHWDERTFDIPSGAVSAEVRLYYQQTSWEYIQFLWLQNDGLNTFLGNEGVNMLDAWLNTGMSPPLEMASATVALGSVAGVPGEASRPDAPAEQMRASWNATGGTVDVVYTPGCDAADHNVYFGDLASVSTYGYSGVECSVGTSGTTSFVPGPGSVFFLVVANDGLAEGSYGEDSLGVPRPEDTATPVCDRTQDLTGVVCE